MDESNVRPQIVKRQIQERALVELGGLMDVICASQPFSYVVNSEMYCELEKKSGLICLVFKQWDSPKTLDQGFPVEIPRQLETSKEVESTNKTRSQPS